MIMNLSYKRNYNDKSLFNSLSYKYFLSTGNEINERNDITDRLGNIFDYRSKTVIVVRLGTSSFPVGYKLLCSFPIYLVPRTSLYPKWLKWRAQNRLVSTVIKNGKCCSPEKPTSNVFTWKAINWARNQSQVISHRSTSVPPYIHINCSLKKL